MRRCCYINLDGAEARRRSVEASFAAAPHEGWTLVRTPAVSAADAASIPGRITPAEKGCFESHLAAIGSTLDDREHVMVLEDDTVLWPQAFGPLEAAIAATPERAWDIIFLNVALGDAGSAMRFATLRRAFEVTQRFRLVDLSQVRFAGAGSYVVNGRIKGALHAELAALRPRDAPYDLVLRRLVGEGSCTGLVLFPFVAAAGPEAAMSQIQDGGHGIAEIVSGAFRRLMSVDRRLEDVRPALEAAERELLDPESRAMGVLIAGMISPRFPRK